jgi:hypothetical protein
MATNLECELTAQRKDQWHGIDVLRWEHLVDRLLEVGSHAASRGLVTMLLDRCHGCAQFRFDIELIGIHRHEMRALGSEALLATKLSFVQFVQELIGNLLDWTTGVVGAVGS